jgi:outer membrane protein OmpA-like peptidoglycan-associated protein
MANGQWGINFQTGSNAINGSTKDLETIYNLLVQAEQAKLKVIGHTDNTGNSNNNITSGPNSVVAYFNKYISADRFH